MAIAVPGYRISMMHRLRLPPPFRRRHMSIVVMVRLDEIANSNTQTKHTRRLNIVYIRTRQRHTSPSTKHMSAPAHYHAIVVVYK